ncbi:hypothetical protein [Caulobacter sp. LjRoot300]|uniref:hypothetical protein n=1 Tax=Caulobacter sp. LjRoot300 TaxID=3342321 RepID=UPI003ECC5B24
MQKQRIVEVEHVENQIIAFPAPSARPQLRLAGADDVSVVGPARRLQNDLARAFAADAGWSVKRTVIVGCVFHGVVLASLALAASNLVPHIAR